MTLLIFDCDGVLVDSEILHAQVECEIGKEVFGIELDPVTHNCHFTGGGLPPVYKFWQQESGKLLPPDIHEMMAQRKNEAFATRLQPIPHIHEALMELTAFPRCVASGTPSATLTVCLRATKLLDYFSPHLFTAEMVAHGKPAPDIFLYAASKMGFDPADCLVIEDSAHGVHAALAAGMKVIGFVGGSHCAPAHAEKLQGAASVISDMRALPATINRVLRRVPVINKPALDI